MNTLAIVSACLLLVTGATAYGQEARTANSCQLVSTLDTTGRIEFRDRSYMTRRPADRADVWVQEQFGSSGRLRYRAEVTRQVITDTVRFTDPETDKPTSAIVKSEAYIHEGAYTCYEIDGRGYATGERYAAHPDRETPYRQVLPNGKTGATGGFVGTKDSVGVWRINDEQGRLAEEITFRDGKRVGPYRRVDAAGTMLQEGQYFRGEAVDTIEVYDPITDQTATRTVALNSSPCGTWQVRGVNGVIKEEEYAPCRD